MVDTASELQHRCGDLDVARRGRIATIVIDRPEKLNALRRRVWRDLRDTFALLNDDGRSRVVILTGAGDRAFSAGGDILEFVEIVGVDDAEAYQREAMAAFQAIEQSPLIVIAAVNGLALGGGCELTFACDIVLASEAATFGMPEARLGLVPGYGIARGPDVIGARMTKYLVASGDAINADRAREIGLVTAVHSPETLLDAAYTLAEQVAAKSTRAITAGKRLIDGRLDSDVIARSIDVLTALQTSADRAEGVDAFLNRRQPIFAPPKCTSDNP